MNILWLLILSIAIGAKLICKKKSQDRHVDYFATELQKSLQLTCSTWVPSPNGKLFHFWINTFFVDLQQSTPLSQHTATGDERQKPTPKRKWGISTFTKYYVTYPPD
jgi:hypothetical protein